jgi:predicted nucleic acid-binding protein
LTPRLASTFSNGRRNAKRSRRTVRAADEIELSTLEHFHVEVAKVFRRDVRHGLLDDDQATQLVVALTEWPLQVVSVAPLLEEGWGLRHNVTVHDALYVVLTRHLPDAMLVSTDRNLPRAPGVDVAMITPDQLPS